MSAEAGSPLRAAAARVLAAVLGQGRSLRAELAAALPRWPDPRDRALLEAICFQALRHRRRYEYVLEAWMQRPLPPREQLVHCLLLAGLAQLDALKLPGHAAVAATAGAARALGRPQMVGLVNALLRRAAREAWPVCDAPAIALSHPDWLVAALQADWPGHWQDILAANNAAAPMWLRPRPRHGDVATLSSALEQAGIACETDPALPGALRLDTPVPVQRIPGWADGSASVQDGSAQLAVLALAPRSGERVLDACAAPGGKAAHIAECLQGEGELLALDQDVRRLARVDETLARLGLAAGNVSTRAADAGDTRAWWDGRPFDAILLDAPCSATGIIRRQPDVKWHRRAEDIPALAAQQARLLDALWPLLAPGGRLLYATCSVLRVENALQVQAFLARTPDARAEDPGEAFGHADGVGRQRLPGEQGMDGFFYALLRKVA